MSDTRLATIVRIKNFDPIPGRDLIHSVTMEGNGWNVVCKKSDFNQIGMLAIFFCLDSLVDDKNPAFDFMSVRRYRISNAKFGGMPSQGLLMPLSILSYYGIAPSEVKEGEDVTFITKTIHYEKTIDLKNSQDIRGGFPVNLGISITDEDNLKSNIRVLPELENEEVYLTIKADGSSGTFILNNGEFQVCSRRLSLKDGGNPWWRMAKKYNIENKLRSLGKNICIQAEVCGVKLNGNKLKLKEEDIFVFNVKELDTQKWYGLNELKEFCNNLGLPIVKVIKVCNWSEISSIEALQAIANGVKYDCGDAAEGIVVRPIVPKWSKILVKWLSVKLLNQGYKD